jgi:hypothetical protein
LRRLAGRRPLVDLLDVGILMVDLFLSDFSAEHAL